LTCTRFFSTLYRLYHVLPAFPVPIIKSAIKRARQSEVRRVRRLPFKTQLKTALRSFTDLIKEGKKADAEKMLPKVFKAIDTAAKKHIIHKNNAARKKSSMAKMVSSKK
jgi:small subunit ribosomal protein S20